MWQHRMVGMQYKVCKETKWSSLIQASEVCFSLWLFEPRTRYEWAPLWLSICTLRILTEKINLKRSIEPSMFMTIIYRYFLCVHISWTKTAQLYSHPQVTWNLTRKHSFYYQLHCIYIVGYFDWINFSQFLWCDVRVLLRWLLSVLLLRLPHWGMTEELHDALQLVLNQVCNVPHMYVQNNCSVKMVAEGKKANGPYWNLY